MYVRGVCATLIKPIISNCIIQNVDYPKKGNANYEYKALILRIIENNALLLYHYFIVKKKH